jgi:hypothetical protein
MIVAPITLASRPICRAAIAQMPRIFARDYRSLRLSLGGPCRVNSLWTASVAVCGAALPFTSIPLAKSFFAKKAIWIVSCLGSSWHDTY